MSTKYPGNIISLGGPESFSNSFNGSTQYLTTPSNAAFALGTGDFTLEFWAFPTANASSITGMVGIGAAATGEFAVFSYFPGGTTNNIVVNATNGTKIVTTGFVVVGAWNHIALSRSSGTLSVFLNGIRIANAAFSDNLTETTCSIGRTYYNLSQEYYAGYISNVRIIKGAALYTANFPLPTGIASNSVPSGTVSLLTCQSSTIVDNSSNAWTLTNNGGVTVSTNTPLQAYNPNLLNPALGSATPGVWNMSEAYQAVQTRSWPMYDPYYNNTVLNLHGNGTNGAQNNTFLDSSSNNYTITRNGSATQGSFSPFSQVSWSVYYGASIANTITSPGSNFAFGTGDFTVECWFYANGAIANTDLMGTALSSGTGSTAWDLTFDSSTSAVRWTTWNTNILTTTTVPTLNTWHHVAVTRSGTTLRIFLDGVQIGTTTDSTNLSSTNTLDIGFGGNGYFLGYISNVRILKGTALYTSGFTPSTTPLTTTSQGATNCVLLCNQSGRFVDNSSNGLAITYVTGNPTVQKFSPFLPNLPYEFSRLGASAYFNGSTDYLSIPALPAMSGDFTIEAWIYNTSVGGSYIDVINQGGVSNGVVIHFQPSGPDIQFSAGGGSISPAFNKYQAMNQWNHVAMSRISGTVYCYINGVQRGTFSSPSTVPSSAYAVGAWTNGTDTWPGYITDVRVVNGTGVYTGAFTPPVKPLATSGAASAGSYPSTTNINTSFASSQCTLLLSNTNGAVFDNAAMNDLVTVGDAQVSTTQSKYGGASIKFDGTGDYLYRPSGASTATTLAGDFTIEGWCNRTSGGFSLICVGDDYTSTGIHVYYSTGNNAWNVGIGNSSRMNGGSTATGTWIHVACVRQSGVVKLFVDGVQISTTYSTTSTFSGNLYVGAELYNGTVYSTTNGYIDDARITNGVARYTGNFQPPTSQLQDQ